ncbi:hypothetical protein D5041_10175 [Verminephrobacter aporrectodeae subsp. tuberculatae]|uniref:hypothetical protein n=1 Tax=Verminephrobacter aporrectodeae TaxID=1110389 RepID=UPI002238C766|nr:hypothetical protein [Verminephrobacter aporrectodeae]MCW5289412.1 hypothetical protein [Verminephrobacter aporrectodeae subsp. tuberculatae]
MAGTALTLRANSGRTATNGEKVRLSAGGNMLVSGGSVMATGSNLSAGKNLTIEANDGSVSLNALSNAAGASVDRITLSAGDDLKVSAFKGSLFATGLQANGRNISLASTGTTRVASSTAYMGSNVVAVSSELTASEGITLASVAGGTSGQVEVVSSGLNAGGQVRLLADDMVFISADTNTIEGVVSPATSGITGGSVLIQAETVQTDAARIRANGNKSSPEKSGDIRITATGDILLDTHTGVASQLNSTGNVALHANRHLTFAQTQVNAGGNLSGTSATGQINGTGASLVARDLLSLSSKDAQTHTNGRYSSGAATIFNQTGHLALNGTSVHATGTSGASGLDAVSGQISVESGGTMEIDAHSLLASRTDLSMIKGLGDFNIGPLIATASHNLTMITRNGNINLTGSAGTSGMGSSRRVVAYVNGDLTLVANNILLEGSYLQAAHGTLNLTANTGNITATALRASKTEAGFLSKTEDNRSRPDGWFEDEKFLRPSIIDGSTGVNIGVQGGNLTLSATSVHAANGKASLQASGHINLEAAQKHRLRRYLASTTAYIGSNVQTVSSELAAREDITLASVAGDTSGRVDVVASGLNAGGQVRLLANDMVFITAGTNTLDGVASPARSGITARQLIQAETVQTDAARIRTNGNKSSTEESGDIAITAIGDILLDTHTGVASQLSSMG